jgi:class 3 adenylate cyclase
MTAALTCNSCGTGLRATAKFCDECGLSTAADQAEYKQVTVLFADVVRSMDIAAALDVERLREIMTELVEQSAAVVQRYGGGSVDYTGDGLMAVFGAPVALEDHAFRACLAALDIQKAAEMLAAAVARRDGVALQLRVGLNSGRVIAGELGTGWMGYTATGAAVGFAQRMESVAPPGGVMLSESTARLVEQEVVLGEPEWVRIKGAAEPVKACQLLAIGPRGGQSRRTDSSLVGRTWEMAALDAMVDRAIGGRGGVVNVVGPPGIGKSRAAREAAAHAAGRGVEVFWAVCESHAGDIAFHVVAQLLRAGFGVTDVDDDTARARSRTAVPADTDDQALLLLDDLLGIADPDVPLPQIDPDARRRRLTALVNTTSLARTEPALFIIEDAHWIDAASESMLADLLTVIPRTPSMVLITARPEYAGALSRVHGAQAIALAALRDSDTAAMLEELLGSDSSVADLAAVITNRASGNPFFAEEMVREFEQRGVLEGQRGGYVCRADVAVVAVPATVQAAIAARIDRLNTPARRTLNAASVIGARFEADLLATLEIDPSFDELLDAELIDQVQFTPSAEYVFHHPLIRAVAYESQLKSARAQWHRRLATAIQERAPDSADENAALIAEHLEAAGELHAAYGWHMRAAAWATNRDIAATRASWLRAGRIADELPDVDPARLSMRIAPLTMLSATDFRAPTAEDGQGRFVELRQLCDLANDKASLAIGMTGPAAELLYAGRLQEGSRIVAEQVALLESVSDSTLTVGLSFSSLIHWCFVGEFDQMERLSQRVIDLAAGDPAKGAGFGIGSPLAAALALQGVARWWLGRPEWRHDLDIAVATARNTDPATLAAIVAWTYGLGIQYGVLRPDEAATGDIEQAVRIAEGFSEDVALSLAEYTLGVALLSRDDAADRQRGLELMTKIRDLWLRQRVFILLPVADLWITRETARRGERDHAIPVMRKAVADLHDAGALGYEVWATGVLVETLLERADESDVAEAEAATGRLAELGIELELAIRDITLLRLRALNARARRDEDAYLDFLARYRTIAESLGYEGHIDSAKAMIYGE